MGLGWPRKKEQMAADGELILDRMARLFEFEFRQCNCENRCFPFISEIRIFD
jgi:hypothetical protein